MIEIPSDWKLVRLADVLVKQNNGKLLQQGWSPQCLANPAPNYETWGVLKTTAIQAGRFEEFENKQLPQPLTPRPAIEVKAGDLIMTCAGPRARCGVPTLVRNTRPRLMLSGKMYRFRPIPEVDPEFLELWLLSPAAQRRIDRMKTGISDSGLNLTHDRFLALPVPVPRLSEQRRIAGILEEHLTSVHAAFLSLEMANRRLSSFLSQWVHERLSATPPVWLKLGDVVLESKTGWDRGLSLACPAPEGFKYIKMNNITYEGDLDLSNVISVRGTDEEAQRYRVRAGDVLFNNRNSPELVGKTALVPSSAEGWTYNNNLVRLRFTGSVDPAFMAMQMSSYAFRGHLRNTTKATTSVAAIYTRNLLQVPVRVPDLSTQTSLVREYEELRGSAQGTRGQIRAATERGNALRKALLSAALSGRLTGKSTDGEITEKFAEEASA